MLKEDPIPFATLCGDWLTAAGFPAGQRYAAIPSTRGLITLVALPNEFVGDVSGPAPRTRPHGKRR